MRAPNLLPTPLGTDHSGRHVWTCGTLQPNGVLRRNPEKTHHDNIGGGETGTNSAAAGGALNGRPPRSEGLRQRGGEEEDFEVPVVLMTLGWDPSGDPTHREDALGRDRSCVFRVLEMERVVAWFTSHTRYDSHTDAKVGTCYLSLPENKEHGNIYGVVYAPHNTSPSMQ